MGSDGSSEPFWNGRKGVKQVQNPKTTIAGYLLVGASVLTVGAHILSGGGVSLVDLQSVVAALGGIGLVLASDGGH